MLSKKAQYAFRALTVLVLNNGNGPFPISAIVKEYPISTKFLETILLELKRGGVLGSRKGKGGGYYLLGSPKDVSFAKVIRILDGDKQWDWMNESDELDGRFHEIMTEVRDAKLKVLDHRTLADLID